jgi:lycopene cyclase domain-containing protein
MIIIILALAMLIFDGYLTALPIVLYNSKSVLAFRLGSIPLEDFSYLIVVEYQRYQRVVVGLSQNQ